MNLSLQQKANDIFRMTWVKKDVKKYSIINQVSPPALDRMPRFCWKPGETFRYESLWSLLNKICLWNAVSPSYLASLLGRTKIPSNVNHCDLTMPDKDITKTIIDLTGIDGKIFHESILIAYLKIRNSTPFVVTRLRFCPVCISQGYHSVIFQLGFVERCPAHNKMLSDKCPRCGQEIPYKISRLNHPNPYTCNCGHKLWVLKSLKTDTDNQFGNEFFENGFKEVIIWLRTKSEKHKLSDYTEASANIGNNYFWPSEHTRNIATYWANILGETSVPKAFYFSKNYYYKQHRHVEAYKKTDHEKIQSKGGGYTYIHSTVNEEFVGIYQNIEEHIRKVVLNNHQDCIKIARDGFFYDLLATKTVNLKCVYAHAYLLWRLLWENKHFPYNLHIPVMPNKLIHLLSVYAQRHRVNLHESVEKTSMASWCDTYVFKNFCQMSFWESLYEVRQRFVKVGYGGDTRHLFARNAPAVIIIPNKQNGTIIIHSWLSNEIYRQTIVPPDREHKKQLSKQINGLHFAIHRSLSRKMGSLI